MEAGVGRIEEQADHGPTGEGGRCTEVRCYQLEIVHYACMRVLAIVHDSNRMAIWTAVQYVWR